MLQENTESVNGEAREKWRQQNARRGLPSACPEPHFLPPAPPQGPLPYLKLPSGPAPLPQLLPVPSGPIPSPQGPPTTPSQTRRIPLRAPRCSPAALTAPSGPLTHRSPRGAVPVLFRPRSSFIPFVALCALLVFKALALPDGGVSFP